MLSLKETLAGLPPEWPEDVFPGIRARLRQSPTKVVVLDDDPTGTQSVHDIIVLTEWTEEGLEKELRGEAPGFYVLTNSRSVSCEQACAINEEIGKRLRDVGARAGSGFIVISRSDSTLRGHFPDEVEALDWALHGTGTGDRTGTIFLICPFFEAGGRYTIEDVHYLAEGDRLIPAAETPFARDPVFSYSASNLRNWVEEKSGGRLRADEIGSISISDIRCKGPAAIADQLASGVTRVWIGNAASQSDLEVLVFGALEAERRGRQIIYRTAASFAATRMGLTPQPPLPAEILRGNRREGGLVVVGSYVPRTTEQLDRLFHSAGGVLTQIEIPVMQLLKTSARENELSEIARRVNQALGEGRDVVMFTSRHLVAGAGASEALQIGQRVSNALVEIVRRLSVQPEFFVAKGGITSSDLATKGLNVKRAMVRGQILPGIPVWQLGTESRFPGMNYVVFPGNVGGPETLREVYRKLRR